MKRIRTCGAILALACGAAAAATNSTLNVNVVTPSGAPVPGAQVVAIYFNGNPDPLSSRVAVANSTGTANFSGANALVDGDFYQIVVATQGFLPSIVDQYNNGAPGVAAAPAVSTPTITVVLSSAGATNLGEIDGAILNATHNALVFGQVSLQSGGGGAVAFGAGFTDGAGAGTLRVYNVPYASANTYGISAFDPILNRSAGANAGGALNGGTSPLAVAGSLDFSNAPPPVANISQTQQSGSAGGLSVSGVTTDTAAPNGNPIPFVSLNFSAQYMDAYGQVHYDWRGAFSDQNGTFQMYGLLPGVTYYASSPGGCSQNNVCYQGFQSTATPGQAPGVNDFLYTSTSTLLQLRIKLVQSPPSNGKLAVYIKDQFGNLFPQAGLGLWPDYAPWQITGGGVCGGPPAMAPNPGFMSLNTNASTGYALITGMPSGNYQLNAWTPYGQSSFNAPNSSQSSPQFYNGQCPGTGGPFYRLTIDTSSASGDVGVYDVYGNVVSSGIGAVNVTVRISTSGTGVVHGTLTFPGVVDLSRSPITIVLYPQCSPNSPCNGGGGFAAFSSTTPVGPVVNYSIAVSSGQGYWMNVLSKYWGAIFPGGNQPQPDLSASTAAVVNMQFQPAGTIYGFMRKPDGSVYVPPTNQGTPAVNAESDSAWGFSQINADGSFSVGGLIPQSYFLVAQSNGVSDFPYTTKHPITQVNVVSGQDTQQDVQLVDAVNVRPNVNLAALPPLSIVNCPPNMHGDCPPERWSVLGVPAGTPINQETADAIITGGGGHNSGEFDYTPSTGSFGNCDAFLAAPGFCPEAVAAGKSGAAYDFYLLRKGGFDSLNLAGGVRPHFVIESSSKNVIVKPSLATGALFSPFGGPSGSTSTVQDVVLTPSPSLAATPQAVLKGAVTISNMISQREFAQLAGNFNGFLQYLPNVWVYDSSGALKATGLVVPLPPNEQLVDSQLKQAVGGGNYTQFQSLMNNNPPSGWGPVGYEIRGLTAGATYSIVATTPNYPPYKGTIALGASGSTTTLNINFDANPGASLAGVVTSTANAPLPGAQVTVKAPGFGPATVTADPAGSWRLDGLGAGLYQVLASAAGYAGQAQNASVSGAGQIVLPTFTLSASNASISGVVYTNNPICPPGSACTAFGKTVLQGVTVFAYDDTLNGANPGAVLPLFRAVTNSSGAYKLDGLVTGDALGLHSYKVFVNAPGYFVLNQSTTAVVGARAGFDFVLKPKPLDVSVFGRPASPNYEFQITNYKQFKTGNAWIGLGGTGAFSKAASTDVSNAFFQQPDANGVAQLFLDYPLANLSTGTVYDLHIEATPNDPHAPLVIKDVNFGLNLPHNTCQGIDQALIGDETGTNAQGLPLNEVPLDISGGQGGNGTALTLPAGGVIPIFSTATPSMCMSESDAASSPLASTGVVTSSGAFASNIYTVTLSSVNYAKGVDLKLSYNQNGASLGDVGVYTYDTPSQQWKAVPGVQTLDPVKGTITVKGLKTLASVLDVRRGMSLMAVWDGKGYRPNGIILRPDDTGVFAVLKPSLLTGSFALPNVRVYNFPNPFSLQNKTVPLNQTASNNCSGVAVPSMVTNGTIIKYEVPNGVSGHAVIRIFTASGRLVQTLDQGDLPGTGTCGYTTWDGKNRSGQSVANGVYYGILTVGGTSVNKGTFKMAVVK